MKEQIIKCIQDNRMSTADVADALGKKGHVPEVFSLNKGFWRVGEVHYLHSWFNSIWITHKELAEAPKNKILFIDNLFSGKTAIAGHLMIEYAMFHKNSIAVVVNGSIRDIHQMNQLPIWCKGFNPIVCERKQVEMATNDAEKNRLKYNGGVIVCDDTGVVLIEPSRINQDTLQKLQTIAKREKEWLDKLSKGMSTFDITCAGE